MTMRMPVMKGLTFMRSLGCTVSKTRTFFSVVIQGSTFCCGCRRAGCLLFLLICSTYSEAATIRADASTGKSKIETCIACHGENGVGLVPSYPNLGGQSEAYLIKQITDIRAGNRKVPEMTGMVEKLTDQDIADIAAWYASQPVVLGIAGGDSLRLGWQLFHGGSLKKGLGACAGCHTPTGSGIASAGFPSLAGQSTQYLIKQLTDFREGARSNDMNGMMRDITGKLSNKEIEALANYISGLYQ